MFSLITTTSNTKSWSIIVNRKEAVSSFLVQIFNIEGIIVNGEYCNSQL